MIWCGGEWGKYITARMLPRGIFLVTPDTQLSWTLNCHQNLQKLVPGGKVSDVTLGE